MRSEFSERRFQTDALARNCSVCWHIRERWKERMNARARVQESEHVCRCCSSLRSVFRPLRELAQGEQRRARKCRGRALMLQSLLLPYSFDWSLPTQQMLCAWRRCRQRGWQRCRRPQSAKRLTKRCWLILKVKKVRWSFFWQSLQRPCRGNVFTAMRLGVVTVVAAHLTVSFSFICC